MSDSKPALPDPNTVIPQNDVLDSSQSTNNSDSNSNFRNYAIIIGIIISVVFILILLRKHLSKIFKRPLKKIDELDNKNKLI